MTIGERIKELRKSKGMSQEDLALKLNVSRQAVQKWESDVNEPNLLTLKLLSTYLDVSIDELVTGNKPQPVNNKKGSNIEVKQILLIVIFALSVILFIGLNVFAIIDPQLKYGLSSSYEGAWYVEFVDEQSDYATALLITFKVLFILSLAGIITPLIFLFKKVKKLNKSN